MDDDAEGADAQHAVSDVPASPRTAESDTEPPTETGSSVADVLHGLEIAYRQNLAAPPPQPTAATAPAPPRETPAHEATAVAAAAPPAAKTYAPTAAAPPAAAPPARAAAATEDAPQKLAARDDPRPRDVYYGEVHQNNNVGTVNEGNVYVIEQYVPYYVPYVAYPRRDGSAPPAYAPRPMSRKPSGSIGSSQGTFSYTDSVFKYPVELVH
jgi:hypothetical protein